MESVYSSCIAESVHQDCEPLCKRTDYQGTYRKLKAS